VSRKIPGAGSSLEVRAQGQAQRQVDVRVSTRLTHSPTHTHAPDVVHKQGLCQLHRLPAAAQVPAEQHLICAGRTCRACTHVKVTAGQHPIHPACARGAHSHARFCVCAQLPAPNKFCMACMPLRSVTLVRLWACQRRPGAAGTTTQALVPHTLGAPEAPGYCWRDHAGAGATHLWACRRSPGAWP